MHPTGNNLRRCRWWTRFAPQAVFYAPCIGRKDTLTMRIPNQGSVRLIPYILLLFHRLRHISANITTIMEITLHYNINCVFPYVNFAFAFKRNIEHENNRPLISTVMGGKMNAPINLNLNSREYERRYHNGISFYFYHTYRRKTHIY